MYEQVPIQRTVYGPGENLLILGSVMKPPKELKALRGKAQCVYADPPFMTGEAFSRKRPYGEKGWRRGSPSLTMEGYADRFPDEKEYLRFLRRVISLGRELLGEEGVFCLHLDWRMSARGRLLCDRVFGPERFLNEIIWAYESGGRSKKSFPRKHETILMYAKGPGYRFDLSRVPLKRQGNRKNHMARGVDENGRTYSSITSHGKEYRYYDDEPVYPGDVWTDIGFLQQKDPERTGYPTQKPLKLLDRLLRPVVREGDLVVDFCCGSGTALEAAERLGCRYAGMDTCPEALAVCQSRLKAENLTVVCPTAEEPAPALTEYDPGAGRLWIRGLELPGDLWPERVPPEDRIEAWETGRIQGTEFRTEARYQRSFRYPALVDSLAWPEGRELPDLMFTDASGARRAYRWTEAPRSGGEDSGEREGENA